MMPKASYTIHYTELPAGSPGDVMSEEWETFRRELPRLLNDGLEGKHILIKGREIVGTYDTFDETYAAGLKAFLLQGFLAQQVLEWQPFIRGPLRGWQPLRLPDEFRRRHAG